MTTIVKAQCHCGLNSFSVHFATDSLPIINDLCHCSSCRHSTGQLTVNYAPFVGVPISSSTNQPSDLSTLISYTVSTIATRWFCSRCSAHILWQYNNTDMPDLWCIAVGTLARTEGLIKTGYHIYIADTLDGGIADNFKVVDGLELPRYTEGVNPKAILPVDWRSPEVAAQTASLDKLSAHCRCGAIAYWITRPTAASALPSAPYPDFTHPFRVTPKDELANPTDEKWWLRPGPDGTVGPTRYVAAHCACDTCRLTSGFEISSWAVVPKANILVSRPRPLASSIGKPQPLEIELVELDLQDEARRPPGLQRYRSSEGRNREFCGTCGASVFWWLDERPEMVDITVALVDETAGGVRAEGWFDWVKGRVQHQEEAVNQTLVQAFAEGLKR